MVLIDFKQQTLTLKEPLATDSQTLNMVFKRQQDKVEVIMNKILKIQQFMDINLTFLLTIWLTKFLSTGASQMSWSNDNN